MSAVFTDTEIKLRTSLLLSQDGGEGESGGERERGEGRERVPSQYCDAFTDPGNNGEVMSRCSCAQRSSQDTGLSVSTKM